MTAARKKPAAECCALVKLVLSRKSERDQAGLSVVRSYDGNVWVDRLVVTMRKARRGDKGALANTTVAYCEMCPFCGAKQP